MTSGFGFSALGVVAGVLGADTSDPLPPGDGVGLAVFIAPPNRLIRSEIGVFE